MFFRKKIKTTINIDIYDWLLTVNVVRKGTTMSRMLCVVNKESNSITICDITCRRNNHGYGSLMIKELIEYSRQNNISYLNGWLSNIDYGHKERLYHFYRKFGFEIVENKNDVSFADIKLLL